MTSLDYKNVLEHFKKQADGKYKPRMIRRSTKGSLYVIEVNKNKKENTPNIQVVVPAEAATKRAESQLEEDIKEQNVKKMSQSNTYHQRGKTLAKRKAKEVQEIKDIFSKKWQRQ